MMRPIGKPTGLIYRHLSVPKIFPLAVFADDLVSSIPSDIE
jgi:hypothetical protein